MKNQYDILKGPCLTEKAALKQELEGKIVFKVHPKANKIEIKREVERMLTSKSKM